MKDIELITQVKQDVVSVGASSAGTDVTSSAIDMSGYDGLMVTVCNAATYNVGNFLKLQQSDDDGVADAYSDIAGSKAIPPASGKHAVINLHRPLKRYIKAVFVRAGASTVVGAIVATRYSPRVFPQVNVVANEMAVTRLIEPAEGTA